MLPVILRVVDGAEGFGGDPQARAVVEVVAPQGLDVAAGGLTDQVGAPAVAQHASKDLAVADRIGADEYHQGDSGGAVDIGQFFHAQGALFIAAGKIAHHASQEVAQGGAQHGIRSAAIHAVIDHQPVQGGRAGHGFNGSANLLVHGGIGKGWEQNITDALAVGAGEHRVRHGVAAGDAVAGNLELARLLAGCLYEYVGNGALRAPDDIAQVAFFIQNRFAADRNDAVAALQAGGLGRAAGEDQDDDGPAAVGHGCDQDADADIIQLAFIFGIFFNNGLGIEKIRVIIVQQGDHLVDRGIEFVV